MCLQNLDTALHKAAYMGQTEAIRVLMKLKANSQIVNLVSYVH